MAVEKPKTLKEKAQCALVNLETYLEEAEADEFGFSDNQYLIAEAAKLLTEALYGENSKEDA